MQGFWRTGNSQPGTPSNSATPQAVSAEDVRVEVLESRSNQQMITLLTEPRVPFEVLNISQSQRAAASALAASLNTSHNLAVRRNSCPAVLETQTHRVNFSTQARTPAPSIPTMDEQEFRARSDSLETTSLQQLGLNNEPAAELEIGFHAETVLSERERTQDLPIVAVREEVDVPAETAPLQPGLPKAALAEEVDVPAETAPPQREQVQDLPIAPANAATPQQGPPALPDVVDEGSDIENREGSLNSATSKQLDPPSPLANETQTVRDWEQADRVPHSPATSAAIEGAVGHAASQSLGVKKALHMVTKPGTEAAKGTQSQRADDTQVVASISANLIALQAIGPGQSDQRFPPNVQQEIAEGSEDDINQQALAMRQERGVGDGGTSGDIVSLNSAQATHDRNSLSRNATGESGDAERGEVEGDKLQPELKDP